MEIRSSQRRRDRGPAFDSQVRAHVVVLVLPGVVLDLELLEGTKADGLAELLFLLGPVAPLDLAVTLLAARWDRPMGDPTIGKKGSNRLVTHVSIRW